MDLDIYGDNKTGYSAHGEYQYGVDSPLAPCPFCGFSDDLTVNNTHTPFYTVQCECGAEMRGDYVESDGLRIGNFKSKKYCFYTHKQAFESAIYCWNTRVLPR